MKDDGATATLLLEEVKETELLSPVRSPSRVGIWGFQEIPEGFGSHMVGVGV